jgi:predicted nuclease with TOPRIM domain
MPENKAEKIRIVLVAALIAVTFVVIILRVIQLSLFSAEMYKIQFSTSSETKALVSELSSKISKLAAQREAIDKSFKTLEQKFLTLQKNELLKEIRDLRFQHQKLVGEIQNLQERVTNLSALEEKTITRILDAYERTAKKQGKFEFVINFILGVFSSIIASLLYSLAAEHKLVPQIALRDIFRKIPIIRKLFQNVQAS